MPDISIKNSTGVLPQGLNTERVRETSDRSNTRATSQAPEERAAPSREETAAVAPTQAATIDAIERLQSYADRLNRDLEFSVDDSSGRTIVTVRDSSTDEVIRQIPSEEALRLANEIDGGVKLFEARA